MSRAMSEELDGVLDEAQEQGRCVAADTRRQTDALSRRAGEEGPLTRVARGLYARGTYWEDLDQSERTLHVMRSLQRKNPDWVFCGTSAALAFGADVSYELQAPLEVASSRVTRLRDTELVTYRDVEWGVYSGEGPVVRSGVRVTPLARTTLDCLRRLSFSEGMVVADYALRGRSGRRESLERYFGDAGRGRRGVAQALETLSHADGRSESGGESIARSLMIEKNIMVPELQVEIANPLDACSPFRVDFVWALSNGRIVLGEFDGIKKYRDKKMTRGRGALWALSRERRREALISLYQLPLLRFGMDEVRRPEELVALLELYGIPCADSSLAQGREHAMPDWKALLRARGAAGVA